MVDDMSAFGLVVRVLFVVFTMIVGIAGNALILVICMETKTLSGRQFLITLAVIDLFGVTVVISQTIPWEQGLMSTSPIFAQAALMQMSYMFVTVAMALDRVLAVFKPYRYKAYRRQMLKIMAVLFGVVICYLEAGTTYVALVEPDREPVFHMTYVACYGIGLMVIVIAYPSIAVKLYRQDHKVRAASSGAFALRTVSQASYARVPIPPTQASASNARAKIPPTQASASNARAAMPPTLAAANENAGSADTSKGKHINALKLYLAILVLFLISFIPTGLVVVLNSKVFAYFTHLNNVGNVFIYYYLIKTFRKRTNQLLSRMRHCC